MIGSSFDGMHLEQAKTSCFNPLRSTVCGSLHPIKNRIICLKTAQRMNPKKNALDIFACDIKKGINRFNTEQRMNAFDGMHIEQAKS